MLIYDQFNKKVIKFDGQSEFDTEFVPKPIDAASIVGVYPTPYENSYILRVNSTDYLFGKGKEPKLFLKQYNAESNTYGETITLRYRGFAPLMVDNRPGGGRYIPFSAAQLIIYHPDNQKLYAFWTGSSKIAEMSSNFDTLRTIPLDLPTQPMSPAERDSIKKDTQSKQWETLGDLLPDVKTPVNKMKLDNKERFWLKLNYHGDTDKWLIMDREGKYRKIVHLPKGSMLTHISDDHLGVRLDDITFALFEPVE